MDEQQEVIVPIGGDAPPPKEPNEGFAAYWKRITPEQRVRVEEVAARLGVSARWVWVQYL